MKFSRATALFAALAALAAVTLTPAPADAAGGGNSAAAKACQNGGYVNYKTSEGARFANEGACVSYAARGGSLSSVPTPRAACESVGGTFQDNGFGPNGETTNGIIHFTCLTPQYIAGDLVESCFFYFQGADAIGGPYGDGYLFLCGSVIE